MTPFLTRSLFSKVSFVNPYLKMYHFMLIVAVGNSEKYVFFFYYKTLLIAVWLPQHQFEWYGSYIFACANVSFHMIWFRGCFYVTFYHSKMKFHSCQNNGNEITLAMSFFSGCLMETVIKDWPDNEMKKNDFVRNETSRKQPHNSRPLLDF